MKKDFNKFLLCCIVIFSIIHIGCRHERGNVDENKEEIVTNESSDDTIAVGEIKFKFFLENSGSMWGYEGLGTDGDFKLAITKLLNTIPERKTGKNMLYIVNNEIHNFDKTYKDFITSGDIYSDIKSIGDPKYTDFKTIFDSIMSNTMEDELSIFVSDLTYSTKDMAVKNNVRILGEAKSLTESVFKEYSNKDIVIIKLLSDFNGSYYVYNQPCGGHQYKGLRPYYIMLFATPRVMDEIFTNDNYKEFRNFEGLKNYQDYYLFACKNRKNPFYTILTGNAKNRSTSMKAEKNKQEDGAVHGVEKISPTRTGDYYITLAVDLRDYFMKEEVKTNPENYIVSSKNNFEIDEIVPIEEGMIAQNEKNLVGSATHLIILHTNDAVRTEEITIEMPNRLPDWIGKSSTDDDTKMGLDSDFQNKTFGLKYICEGIHEAYYGTAETPLYFKLSIKVK